MRNCLTHKKNKNKSKSLPKTQCNYNTKHWPKSNTVKINSYKLIKQQHLGKTFSSKLHIALYSTKELCSGNSFELTR